MVATSAPSFGYCSRQLFPCSSCAANSTGRDLGRAGTERSGISRLFDQCQVCPYAAFRLIRPITYSFARASFPRTTRSTLPPRLLASRWYGHGPLSGWRRLSPDWRAAPSITWWSRWSISAWPTTAASRTRNRRSGPSCPTARSLRACPARTSCRWPVPPWTSACWMRPRRSLPTCSTVASSRHSPTATAAHS